MLIRALVEDTPDQTAKARAALSQDFILTASVIVEAEWVLRSQYRWPPEAIAAALREILDLPSLAGAPERIAWALDRFAAGADFADMVHIASAEGASRFVTFDKRIARKAGSGSPIAIETLA